MNLSQDRRGRDQHRAEQVPRAVRCFGCELGGAPPWRHARLRGREKGPEAGREVDLNICTGADQGEQARRTVLLVP